jgi:hypothetical protein
VHRAWLVIALASCGARPHIVFGVPRLRTVALGEAIPITFGWYKTCHHSPGVFDKNDKYLGPYPCDGEDSSLEVTCSHRCDVEGSDQGEASKLDSSEMHVIPRELGRTHLTATIRHKESRDTQSRTADVVVELPRATICVVEEAPNRSACHHGPLDPRHARVWVRLDMADERVSDARTWPDVREVHSELVAINNHKLPFTSAIALADLFPKAVTDGEVKPGTYQLVVSLDGHILTSEEVVVASMPAP